jgi:hypothetical protein
MVRLITLGALIALALPASLAQLDQSARRPAIATVRFMSSLRGNPSYYSLAITRWAARRTDPFQITTGARGNHTRCSSWFPQQPTEMTFQLARSLHLLRGDFRTTYPITNLFRIVARSVLRRPSELRCPTNVNSNVGLAEWKAWCARWPAD